MNRAARRKQEARCRSSARHATGRTREPMRPVDARRIAALRAELAPGGWVAEVDRAWENGWFVVLGRVQASPAGDVLHLAVRTLASGPIGWADLQWVKDQVAGPERCAVEFYPERSRLVDDADMYHLWVLPRGTVLPFGFNMAPRMLAAGGAA